MTRTGARGATRRAFLTGTPATALLIAAALGLHLLLSRGARDREDYGAEPLAPNVVQLAGVRVEIGPSMVVVAVLIAAAMLLAALSGIAGERHPLLARARPVVGALCFALAAWSIVAAQLWLATTPLGQARALDLQPVLFAVTSTVAES